MIIDIAPDALNYIKMLYETGNIPSNYFFRITANGPYGALIDYSFGFSPEPSEGDIIIDSGSIRILMDSETAFNIEGSSISYSPDSGFIIRNPESNRIKASHNGNKHNHKKKH